MYTLAAVMQPLKFAATLATINKTCCSIDSLLPSMWWGKIFLLSVKRRYKLDSVPLVVDCLFAYVSTFVYVLLMYEATYLLVGLFDCKMDIHASINNKNLIKMKLKVKETHVTSGAYFSCQWINHVIHHTNPSAAFICMAFLNSKVPYIPVCVKAFPCT